MERKIIVGTIVALTFGVSAALADEVNIPHTFEANTPAKADEVNENFDALKNSVDDNNSRLLQIEQGNQDGPCAGIDDKDEMVQVGTLCVDKYEASVWNAEDGSTDEGAEPMTNQDQYNCEPNGNDCTDFFARSEGGVRPATDITWFQAQQACANSGKRLLTNAEWQMAVAGTPDPAAGTGGTAPACNTESGELVDTGSRDDCVSNHGVHDMIGNAWEWVADWMQGTTNQPEDHNINSGDYGEDRIAGIREPHAAADADGDDEPDEAFPGALMRGGNYTTGQGGDTDGQGGGTDGQGGGTDAGAFALFAQWQPSAHRDAVGFRCAR